jgi:hypothetical protein
MAFELEINTSSITAPRKLKTKWTVDPANRYQWYFGQSGFAMYDGSLYQYIDNQVIDCSTGERIDLGDRINDFTPACARDIAKWRLKNERS